MSQKVVEQIIGRMLLDREFRKLVAADMGKALAGYELSEDERNGLKNIDLNDFHQAVSGLDERISKARAI